MNLQHKKLTEELLAKLGFDHNHYYYEKITVLKGTERNQKIGYCGYCGEVLTSYPKALNLTRRKE